MLVCKANRQVLLDELMHVCVCVCVCVCLSGGGGGGGSKTHVILYM